MSGEFDLQAMTGRFRERAKAVKSRGLPPVEGPARQQFAEAAKTDLIDFSLIGDAETSVEDGVIVLRIRPR